MESNSQRSRKNILDAARTGVERHLVAETVEQYNSFYNEENDGNLEARKSNYTQLIDQYYDLVTDFYQYGWGNSFHFAPRLKSESFEASLKRHELFLAHKMNLRSEKKVLDVGCGVGGPLEVIAKATGSQITGINNNAYQLQKAKTKIAQAGLESLCDFVRGDFMQMPFADATFDGVYQIAATAHAPDKVKAYSEIYRVLKPGGIFAGYEWCMSDTYDSSNSFHRKLKQQIEAGNALPNLPGINDVREALTTAGFAIAQAQDRALTGELPWYLPLTSKELSRRGFARSPLGRTATDVTVRVLEKLRIAPQGATEVSRMLNEAGDVMVASGELGIFTPMYFYLAQKPV